MASTEVCYNFIIGKNGKDSIIYLHTPVEEAEHIGDCTLDEKCSFFKLDLYDGNMYIKERGRNVFDN